MMPSEDSLPDLVAPVMVCAFSGWNDAGEAASSAVEHLALTWDARPYATLEGEEYYDFQVNRPQVSLVDGVSRRITWPGVDISIARMPSSGRDLVLVSGPEPNLRWLTFCEEILDVVRDLGVERLVLLGGLSTDSHFERRVPVSGSAWDARSAARYALAATRYEGPTGVTGLLHHLAVRSGFEAVSFWAGTPYYVSAPVWSPATVALLRRVEQVIGEDIPLGTLDQQAAASIDAVRALVDADPSMREHIDALADEPEIDSTTADELAAEFERYLRRHDDDGKG
ncbi:PAC2 family protein [Cumulibacter manganitolerans]|uniref:PAC2 family protein n=1 Tax=Cumulibacter manganitolerans TaxID=1884992 RepID=UPI001E591BF7|nr:PAC2 family protein [Cumulibacter manganitolerans]